MFVPMPTDESTPRPPFDDKLKTSVHADAVARDPRAADSLRRAKTPGHTQAGIAKPDGVPVDRVRKRIERLVAKMRATPRALAAYGALVLVVVFTIVWQSQTETVADPNSLPRAAATPITPPPPSAMPVKSANTPNERAARDLRRLAFIAYEDDRYGETLEYLDKARRVDPEGDTTEQVQTARHYCETQRSKEKSATGDGSAQAAPK
jgi:hypothetical protein